MKKDKYYTLETTSPIKYEYRYRISFPHNYIPIIKPIKNKLMEMGAMIMSSGSHELLVDMNIEVEELADVLYEQGMYSAGIKQTKHKAYSLRERG